MSDSVARQTSLFMGLSRQEYWRGLPCPSPGHLPDAGIETASLTLAGEFFTTEPPGKARETRTSLQTFLCVFFRLSLFRLFTLPAIAVLRPAEGVDLGQL